MFDEETRAALAESGGDQEYARFPENHRFQIPENCHHWSDVREKTIRTRDSRFRKRCGKLRKIKPVDALYGIFGDAQWTNKERLSDALIRDLIEHFSRLPLGNANVTSDILGQVV